jgi:N utilization substance protein A
MEVVVEDKQLSLAIGKKGQNVRLAAKLTGWRIDIKSEEEKRREVEAQFGALEIGEGDAAAQMDALFPDTPQSGDGNDAADLSVEALEQSEVGEGATAEAAESGDASESVQADLSAEAAEAGETAKAEESEPAKADEQV